MNYRKRIESKVTEQDRLIARLEQELVIARAYRAGLQETLKVLPTNGTNQAVYVLRPGSDLAKVCGILKDEGHALHVDELLRRLGKELTRANRGGLGGSLSSYARQGKFFTKAAPNTFGLIEFKNASPTVEVTAEELLADEEMVKEAWEK